MDIILNAEMTGGGDIFCVLLVEDEVHTLQLLGALVRSLRPECEVRLAQNGLEALRIVKETEIQLVLTDIRMPQMDGIELSKRLYEQHFSGKVAIISAYDMFEYAQQAIRYQVFAYLLKPIDADALVEIFDRAQESSIGAQKISPDACETLIADVDRFQLCLSYLNERYAEDISLDKISGYLHLHPAYFSTWFKKRSGKTFVNYLNGLRVDCAKNMLRQSTHNVKQISSPTGFQDVGYFIKQFRARTQQTPSQFRLNMTLQKGGEDE